MCEGGQMHPEKAVVNMAYNHMTIVEDEIRSHNLNHYFSYLFQMEASYNQNINSLEFYYLYLIYTWNVDKNVPNLFQNTRTTLWQTKKTIQI